MTKKTFMTRDAMQRDRYEQKFLFIILEFEQTKVPKLKQEFAHTT